MTKKIHVDHVRGPKYKVAGQMKHVNRFLYHETLSPVTGPL
jgi:hypothetical protein